jgi:hypothetical protein
VLDVFVVLNAALSVDPNVLFLDCTEILPVLNVAALDFICFLKEQAFLSLSLGDPLLIFLIGFV